MRLPRGIRRLSHHPVNATQMPGELVAEPLQVVYLMGAGHSGSTVLGVTLGNCQGFFYAGEVEEWLAAAGRPRWGGAERSEFWQRVREQVDAGELAGAEVNRHIERSSVVLRPDRLWRRRSLLAPYRRVSATLLEAIARTADARCVVDSSHFPLRARELQKLDGIELYLLLLIRDPQSVVDSNVRELSAHDVAERRWRSLKVNAGLWLTLLTSTLVFLSHPRARRMLVRHEDFLADPAGVVEQILRLVGSSADIPDLDALAVGAPLQGNRLLRDEVISVRRGRPAVPRWSPLTALLQRPWQPILSRLRPAAGARSTGRETRSAAP
jgi:hypothetical protein